MPDISQKTIGFSTAATTIRPPVGRTWVIRSAVEVGTAPTLNITDGTTTEAWRTSDADTNRGVAITNEWYLSCTAATATTGWLITVEFGFETFSFVEA